MTVCGVAVPVERGESLTSPFRGGELLSKAVEGPVTSCWMSGRVNRFNAYHCGLSPLSEMLLIQVS